MQILLVDNQIDTDTDLSHFTKFLKSEYGEDNVVGLKYVQDAKICFKYDYKSIDFIFLDIEFGSTGRNLGLEFLNEIRDTDPDIPVCIVTKYNDIDRTFESGKSLATFYITKRDLRKKFSIISNLITESKNKSSFRYNRRLMKSVNSSFADDYDKSEYSKSGTIAFLHWEDQVIKKTLKIVNDEFKNKTEPLKILDVACGTGRYEVLFHEFQKELNIKTDITAMDFAGKMLVKTREKLEKIGVYVEPYKEELTPIKLKRGIAEKMPFQDEEFNMVIFGFGVPSYTKFNYSIPEAFRVLKPNGYAVFTVYNKNSLFNYYRNFFEKDINECPLASWVDFKHFPDSKCQGYYVLVPQGKKEKAFKIQTFTINEFKDILNRFNFEYIYIETFPTLYSTLPMNTIKSWSRQDDKKGNNKVEFSVNYVPPNGEAAPFSHRLYEIDKKNSLGRDGGFYITAIAKKVNVNDV